MTFAAEQARARALELAQQRAARRAQELRNEIVRTLSQPGTQLASLRRTYRTVSHRQAQRLGLRGRSVQTENGDIRTRVRSGFQEVKVSAPGAAPAVQTGRLRQSITVQQVNDSTFRVGTNVEYAEYLEFGTFTMHARPFMRPSFERVRARLNNG